MTTVALITDDLVASKGRIKVLQNQRPRFIQFGMAKVLATDAVGVTVTPVGKRALLVCRPEDLEVVEPANRDLQQTPASRESARQQAEHVKGIEAQPVKSVTEPEHEFLTGGVIPSGTTAVIPAGTIPVSGDVEEEAKPRAKKQSKSLKELREKKQSKPRSVSGEPSLPTPKPRAKPKAKPRRRRDR